MRKAKLKPCWQTELLPHNRQSSPDLYFIKERRLAAGALYNLWKVNSRNTTKIVRSVSIPFIVCFTAFSHIPPLPSHIPFFFPMFIIINLNIIRKTHSRLVLREYIWGSKIEKLMGLMRETKCLSLSIRFRQLIKLNQIDISHNLTIWI